MRSLLAPLLWLAIPASTLSGQNAGNIATVRVPATSNPYLAGMPRGTKARLEDIAPDESPVLVELSLANAVAVTFKATGAAEHAPFNPPQFDPPDGSSSEAHRSGAEHGISDITAPVNSLLGVFLDDDRPDRTRAPKPLNLRGAAKNVPAVSPQLKQIFFIGAGATKAGVRRRYLVPKGATRLFLGVMDGFDWYNNQGSFAVAVTIERSDVSSNMYSVDSKITFADWACLPDRSQCTPDHPTVKELAPGKYHVILPAQLEWGASIPTPAGASATILGASGTVCLDSQSRSTSSCNGPQGNGAHSGAGFLSPDEAAGALIRKTADGRIYFSVNGRGGTSFQNHEGYFEFDVTVQ